MRQSLFHLCTIALLSACSLQTPYQSERFKGGFVDMPLSGGRYRISVRGNGVTDRQRVTNIAMVRAAELALQNGHSYFGIDDVGESSRTRLIASANSISSVDNAYVTLIVRFSRSGSEAGMMNAQATIDRLGPSVGYKPNHS